DELRRDDAGGDAAVDGLSRGWHAPLYARVERGAALRLQAGVVVAVCVAVALGECDGLRLGVRWSALDARVGARLIRLAPGDAVEDRQACRRLRRRPGAAVCVRPAIGGRARLWRNGRRGVAARTPVGAGGSALGGAGGAGRKPGKSCNPCHADDAPDGTWPLTGYGDVYPWASPIRQDLCANAMPPADGGIPIAASDRLAVLAWIQCGAPP